MTAKSGLAVVGIPRPEDEANTHVDGPGHKDRRQENHSQKAFMATDIRPTIPKRIQHNQEKEERKSDDGRSKAAPFFSFR